MSTNVHKQNRQHTNSSCKEPLLEADLSYDIIGCCIQIRKDYGLGQKESVYQNALEEEFEDKHIKFEREKSIPVKSKKTNKTLGFYKPDFIIDNKIILEIEVFPGSFTNEHLKRLTDYLNNSEYELGYLVNFGKSSMQYRRVILTNDHKNKTK